MLLTLIRAQISSVKSQRALARESLAIVQPKP